MGMVSSKYYSQELFSSEQIRLGILLQMSWDIESAINLKIQKKRRGQDIVHHFKALGNFYKVVTDRWKSVLHSVGFLPWG